MNFNSAPQSPSLENSTLIIRDIVLPVDKDGYVTTASFATQILKKQNKNVAGLLDKVDSEDYFLGESLRVKGDAGNYSEMKIHKDDIEEFIRRYEEVYGTN